VSRSPRSAGSARPRLLACALGVVAALAVATPGGPARAQEAAGPSTPAAPLERAPAAAEPASPSGEPALPPAVEDGIAFTWKLIQLAAFLAGMSALGWLSVRVLGPRLAHLGTKPGDLIKIVEQKRLDPRTTLYVVEVAGKHALLAVSDREVRALSAVSLDDPAARAVIEERASSAQGSAPAKGGLAFANVLSGERARAIDSPGKSSLTSAAVG